MALLVFTLLLQSWQKRRQILSDPEIGKYDIPDRKIINKRKICTLMIENGLLWYIISAFLIRETNKLIGSTQLQLRYWLVRLNWIFQRGCLNHMEANIIHSCMRYKVDRSRDLVKSLLLSKNVQCPRFCCLWTEYPYIVNEVNWRVTVD